MASAPTSSSSSSSWPALLSAATATRDTAVGTAVSASTSLPDARAMRSRKSATRTLKTSPVKPTSRQWQTLRCDAPSHNVFKSERQPSHADAQTSSSPTSPMLSTCLIGAATSSLAKFKAEQDLHIQTDNLPTPSSSLQAASSSSTTHSASSSTFTTPSTDTSSCATPETPAPSSSTGKKRQRRTAAQIDRKFSCTFPGCAKAYGTEGSLTQHQRLKHSEQAQDAAAAAGAKALSRPPQSKSRGHRAAAANASAHACAAAATGAPRMSPIQSAVMEGFGQSVAFGMAEASPASSQQLLAPATQRRQNLRSRANSMPLAPTPTLATQSSTSSNSSSNTSARTPRPWPQTTTIRKGRGSGTPRAPRTTGSSNSTRRGKSRSKSESLEFDDIFLSQSQPPQSALTLRTVRSASDSFMVDISSSHNHHSLSSSLSSSAPQSFAFDWSAAAATAASAASDSPSSDQAIDSDILSVLADCDSSDSGMDLSDAGADPLSNARESFHSASELSAAPSLQLLLPAPLARLECYDPLVPATVVPATPIAPAPTIPPPLVFATGGLRINDLFRRAQELEDAASDGSNKPRGVALDAFTSSSPRPLPLPASTVASSSSSLSTVSVTASTSVAPLTHWATAPIDTPSSPTLDTGFLSADMERMSMLWNQQQHQTSNNVAPASASRASLAALLEVSAPDPTVLLDAPAAIQPTSLSTNDVDDDEKMLPGAMASLEDFAPIAVGAAANDSVKAAPLHPVIATSSDSVERMDVCEPSTALPTSNFAFESFGNQLEHLELLHAHWSSEPTKSSSLEPQQHQQMPHWTTSDATHNAPTNWSALEANNQYIEELFLQTAAAAGGGAAGGVWRLPRTDSTGSSGATVLQLQRGATAVSSSSDKLLTATLSDNNSGSTSDMFFDVAEFGLEDTRMGSPLLCQQEEL